MAIKADNYIFGPKWVFSSNWVEIRSLVRNIDQKGMMHPPSRLRFKNIPTLGRIKSAPVPIDISFLISGVVDKYRKSISPYTLLIYQFQQNPFFFQQFHQTSVQWRVNSDVTMVPNVFKGVGFVTNMTIAEIIPTN